MLWDHHSVRWVNIHHLVRTKEKQKSFLSWGWQLGICSLNDSPIHRVALRAVVAMLHITSPALICLITGSFYNTFWPPSFRPLSPYCLPLLTTNLIPFSSSFKTQLFDIRQWKRYLSIYLFIYYFPIFQLKWQPAPLWLSSNQLSLSYFHGSFPDWLIWLSAEPLMILFLSRSIK